jgi:hypothetical protein
MAPKPYDFRERSFLFACDIVAFAGIVADRGYILAQLAKQLVKSGSSVGARTSKKVWLGRRSPTSRVNSTSR